MSRDRWCVLVFFFFNFYFGIAPFNSSTFEALKMIFSCCCFHSRSVHSQRTGEHCTALTQRFDGSRWRRSHNLKLGVLAGLVGQ